VDNPVENSTGTEYVFGITVFAVIFFRVIHTPNEGCPPFTKDFFPSTEEAGKIITSF